jgi:hypothetical protein
MLKKVGIANAVIGTKELPQENSFLYLWYIQYMKREKIMWKEKTLWIASKYCTQSFTSTS